MICWFSLSVWSFSCGWVFGLIETGYYWISKARPDFIACYTGQKSGCRTCSIKRKPSWSNIGWGNTESEDWQTFCSGSAEGLGNP